MKGYRVLFIFISFLLLIPNYLHAKQLKIKKEFKGSLITNILGTSETFPPYVKIIRSKEGMKYMLREFKQIRNYTVYGKTKQLERELNKINFVKNMLISVMTQPVDNYSLKVTKAKNNTNEKRIEIFVTYSHKNRAYDIPPKKSIYYHMIVVNKSDLPIMLNLNNISSKKKMKKYPVSVTGRLLYWKYSDLQLIPVKIRKRKNIIYYIKGNQVKWLEKYVGRVVTLKGILSRDQYSPYEKDMIVDKVLKVHEKL